MKGKWLSTRLLITAGTLTTLAAVLAAHGKWV
jgi:hypothetical protein